MNSSTSASAATLVAQLRTPLARIQLAASQLEREATKPSLQHLAERIHDAVRELNTQIGTLRARLAGVTEPEPLSDSVPVIDELCRRLVPIIELRNIRWQGFQKPTAAVRGNSDALRRVALRLLRVGAHWAGSGGALALHLEEDTERVCLRLDCSRAESIPEVDADADLRELRALAALHAGTLECKGAETCHPELRLWFAAGGTACAAS